MRASDDTKQCSTETLRAERTLGKIHTRADAPVYPVDEEFWRNARVMTPLPNKAPVHPRADADKPK
jgi:hypothetical protein